MVNAIGLSNPGLDWWCKKIGPSVSTAKIPLIVSLFGTTKELSEMAATLNSFNLVGLEINASCPNTRDNLLSTNITKIIEDCKAVKTNSNLPIILKLSTLHDISLISKEIEDLVEALSINSVPYEKN